MGFFSGIVGGILGGGGGTKVSQQSTNQTDVTVNNEITIDTSTFAASLEAVGKMLNETIVTTSEKTKALFSALVLTGAAQAKEKNEENEILQNAVNRGFFMLKIAGIAFAGWFIWKKVL